MAAISKEQQAHLFEFSCRCLLAEQGANRPEQFSRVANQYIYNGKRKFEKDAVGMAALKVFFSRTNPTAQKFGDEWRQLVKELELKKDSKPQKRKNDGLDPQSIEFDILMHGEAVAPDKAAVEDNPFFHHLLNCNFALRKVLPKAANFLPALRDLLQWAIERWGYIAGECTLDNDFELLKKKILQLERVLWLLVYRLLAKGFTCQSVLEAVNYAFIAAPEFPCKDGTLQTDATCLGHWIVANKKLVPKCYELLRHGHLLFLRNTETIAGPQYGDSPGQEPLPSAAAIARIEVKYNHLQKRINILSEGLAGAQTSPAEATYSPSEASAQLLERDTSAEGNVTRHGNFAMNANADGYTLTAGSSAAAVQRSPKQFSNPPGASLNPACQKLLLQTNIMDNGVLGDCKDTAKNLSMAFNRAASAPDSAASSAAQRGVHRASVDLSAARSPSSAVPNSNPAFAIPDASAAHDGSGDSASSFTFSSVPSATPGSVQSGASVGHGAPAHSPLTPPTGPSGLLQHSPASCGGDSIASQITPGRRVTPERLVRAVAKMEDLKEKVYEMAADSSNDPAYTRTLELCLRQGQLKLTYQEAHVALLKQLGLLQGILRPEDMAAGEEELLNPGVQPLESAVPAGRSSSAGHVIHLPDLAGLDEASLQALLDRLTPRLQQGLQHSIASLHEESLERSHVEPPSRASVQPLPNALSAGISSISKDSHLSGLINVASTALHAMATWLAPPSLAGCATPSDVECFFDAKEELPANDGMDEPSPVTPPNKAARLLVERLEGELVQKRGVLLPAERARGGEEQADCRDGEGQRSA
ncbi:hypothetical protein WJX75_008336 [Coccomyxa subellipsoidea]|uniref:Uncharacterized protein n=1 Tax=Coccomyxa subellipsoidea TaxID=248742 RepID=A0ABR2YFL8_9CHLO